MSTRVRLPVGLHPGLRVVVVVVGFVPFLATTGLLIGTAGHMLVKAFTERPLQVLSSILPAVILVSLLLLGAYITGFMTYLTLALVRQGQWLDGTRLGERLAFRTRWVDLATAAVTLRRERIRESGVDLLVVRDPDSGTEVRFAFQAGPTGRIRSRHFMMLADAITSGRSGRDDRDDATAVAAQLRAAGTVRAAQAAGELGPAEEGAGQPLPRGEAGVF